MDATDDTTIEDFTLELHAKKTRQRSRARQVIRRSVSEDRYVIVWRTFIDPTELSDTRVSGMRFIEKGYVMVRKSPSCSTTLLQLHLATAPIYAEGGSGSTVGAMTDFVLASRVAYVAATHQMIENVLVEQALRNSGGFDAEERTGIVTVADDELAKW